MVQNIEREFSCSLCKAKFFSGSELSEHFRLNHRTNLQWVFDQ